MKKAHVNIYSPMEPRASAGPEQCQVMPGLLRSTRARAARCSGSVEAAEGEEWCGPGSRGAHPGAHRSAKPEACPLSQSSRSCKQASFFSGMTPGVFHSVRSLCRARGWQHAKN